MLRSLVDILLASPSLAFALLACSASPAIAPPPGPTASASAPRSVASASSKPAPPAAEQSIADGGAPPTAAGLALAIDSVRPGGTIGMGDFASCAVTSKHEVSCWGMGADREKYPEDIVRSKTPKTIAGLTAVTRVAAGYRYACALHSAGDVTCWGMLDPDAEKKGGATRPAKVAGVADALEIGVGRYEACARTRAGDVLCWGQVDGQKVAAKAVLVKRGAARMAVGNGALCVISAAGAVACAGGAASGAHGTPLTEWKPMPDLGPALDIAAQVGLVCVVSPDGRLACDGDRAAKMKKPTAGVKGAKRVWLSDSTDFGCALVSEAAGGDAGKLVCWGDAYAGQLGDGTVVHEVRGPLEPKLDEPVIDAVAGPANACARTVSGRIYCWGGNHEWGVAPPSAGDLVKTPLEVRP